MRFLSLYRFVVLLILMAHVGGCGLTLGTTTPLYDPRTDTKFEGKFLGEWVPEYFVMCVLPAEGNAYRITTMLPPPEDNSPWVPKGWVVDLIHIGKYDYVFYRDPKAGADAGTMLLPCWRVEASEDRLSLRILNVAAITKDLQEHPGQLKYATRNIFAATQPTTQPCTQPAEGGEIAVNVQIHTEITIGASTQPATVASKSTAPVPVNSSRLPATQPTTQPAVAGLMDFIVLTDEPVKIREYLIRHQDDPGMFGEPTRLYRLRFK